MKDLLKFIKAARTSLKTLIQSRIGLASPDMIRSWSLW